MNVTAAEIRKLVDRPATDACVTSLYLDTDGSRYPKAADYLARLDALVRDARRAAERLDVKRRASVHADLGAIDGWVRSRFDRGETRGLAVFSSQGEVFEQVQVAISVRNILRIADSPYVVPLQALLGRSHHVALVIIERDRARILRYHLGRAWEYMSTNSAVHGQHEKGGWSQARFQRNIENDVLLHKKDTAEVLRRLHSDERVDALVLAGPHEEAVDFSKLLHPYLREVQHGELLSLPLHAGAGDLRDRLRQIEQELVSRRRRELLERLAAAQGQAEKAAFGVRHVVEAVNAKRVGVLFVVEGAGVPGWRSASGALALHEDEAAAYGTPVDQVDDIVDEVIEEAVRADAQVELFRDGARLHGHPVAALLRF